MIAAVAAVGGGALMAKYNSQKGLASSVANFKNELAEMKDKSQEQTEYADGLIKTPSGTGGLP